MGNSGAQAGFNARRESREEAGEISAIFEGADLDGIEREEHVQFETKGAQILPPCFDAFERAAHERQAAGDGLEINVVFEQGADQAAVWRGVLAEGGVFELNDIDAVLENQAIDEPEEVAGLEFVDGVRSDGAQRGLGRAIANGERCGAAERGLAFR